MANKITLCIFDLDGVIVDTAKFHFLAWRNLARTFGYELTKEQNENLKGVSRVQSLDYLLEWAGVSKTAEEKAILAASKNDEYVASVQQMDTIEALAGVIDFIHEIKQENIKIAIGSASKNAKLILERMGIIDLFDAIVDGTMTTKGKPDPEVFLLGAQLANCKSKNTIVFEDASKGINAALAADMYAVGIGDEQQLGHAHLVIAGFENVSFEQLITLI